MKNEEIGKKLEELLEAVKEKVGYEEVPEEKRKEGQSKFKENILEDLDNREVQCGIYSSNNGIAVFGAGYELAGLLSTIIQNLLDQGIIDEDKLDRIIKMSLKEHKAQKNGDMDTYFKESLEEIMDKISEAFDL